MPFIILDDMKIIFIFIEISSNHKSYSWMYNEIHFVIEYVITSPFITCHKR
jgi:hypothetical protein